MLGFKQMTHVILHTFWGYLMVKYVMEMKRLSFLREYIRDVFGRETSCFLFGLIFYLTIPVLCVLQNLLVMTVVNIRGCKEEGTHFGLTKSLSELFGRATALPTAWELK